MNHFKKSNSRIKITRFVLSEILAVAAITAAVPAHSYQKVKQETYH